MPNLTETLPTLLEALAGSDTGAVKVATDAVISSTWTAKDALHMRHGCFWVKSDVGQLAIYAWHAHGEKVTAAAERLPSAAAWAAIQVACEEGLEAWAERLMMPAGDGEVSA